VSIGVSVDELFDEVAEWGAGFLVTVGDDERARVIALRPEVVSVPEGRTLRFSDAGRSACANAALRDHVTIVFPAKADSDGFSLIVDGRATVDPESQTLDVRPLSAVRHRAAR
jgi:hypothetical protein